MWSNKEPPDFKRPKHKALGSVWKLFFLSLYCNIKTLALVGNAAHFLEVWIRWLTFDVPTGKHIWIWSNADVCRCWKYNSSTNTSWFQTFQFQGWRNMILTCPQPGRKTNTRAIRSHHEPCESYPCTCQSRTSHWAALRHQDTCSCEYCRTFSSLMWTWWNADVLWMLKLV